jgi:hypothetical protein
LKQAGNVLTKEEAERQFLEYLEEMDMKDIVSLNFSEHLIAGTSVSYDSRNGKMRINIGLPI